MGVGERGMGAVIDLEKSSREQVLLPRKRGQGQAGAIGLFQLQTF